MDNISPVTKNPKGTVSIYTCNYIYCAGIENILNIVAVKHFGHENCL